ncbi:hypothetical protein BT96DRAFT_947553 [Gymnopus androsaceus JB14]|uniref:Uncharacterized protein n=1 Tax=Gymnopus androsaceus JB14 TaxID=1447944 RepID=A0A6A4GSX3_9AGAR|nr:hypothetical protein BT96DRAFT_947553 [Gymnopus androsaceus JB14]
MTKSRRLVKVHAQTYVRLNNIEKYLDERGSQWKTKILGIGWLGNKVLLCTNAEDDPSLGQVNTVPYFVTDCLSTTDLKVAYSFSNVIQDELGGTQLMPSFSDSGTCLVMTNCGTQFTPSFSDVYLVGRVHMVVFPSLETLCILRNIPFISSDISRNFKFIYLHPDSPLPLLQSYNLTLHSDQANVPGHGACPNPWSASFHLLIRNGPYHHPTGISASTIAGITIEEVPNEESLNGLFIILYGDPPLNLPLCTNKDNCTRGLSTSYCNVHGLVMAVDSVDELHSATAADLWVIWE